MPLMALEQPIESLVEVDAAELSGLDAKLSREREWYADVPRFQTDDDIAAAIGRGALVYVTDTDDFMKTARFNASEPVPGFTPFLTPRAAAMVTELSHRWRVLLWEDYHVQHNLDRLALTSLVRTQSYQDALIAAGKLASVDSTHCTGNAVDVDVSGYYRLDAVGRVESHAHPARREGQLRIRKALEQKYGVMQDAPRIARWWDCQITEAAIRVARLMHHEGSINLVEEFSGTENACIHLAVNPDYEPIVRKFE